MAGKVFVSVSLDAEKDADLISWINSQQNKSEAIREALRAALSGQQSAEVTLMDLYHVLGEIRRKLDQGVVTVGDGDPVIGEEPDDLALALDGLGVD